MFSVAKTCNRNLDLIYAIPTGSVLRYWWSFESSSTLCSKIQNAHTLDQSEKYLRSASELSWILCDVIMKIEVCAELPDIWLSFSRLVYSKKQIQCILFV